MFEYLMGWLFLGLDGEVYYVSYEEDEKVPWMVSKQCVNFSDTTYPPVEDH